MVAPFPHTLLPYPPPPSTHTHTPSQFLEAELKQSYATKNFTVKSGLLELEKLYRSRIDEQPDMAALWADVTVLLVGGGVGGLRECVVGEGGRGLCGDGGGVREA
jgi:hypothetical protein